MNSIKQTSEVVEKLNQLKEDIKECIISESFQLPLYTYFKEFSFDTLRYENYKKNKMVINLNTICTVTRMLEIIQITLNLIQKGEYITKRNLYYKLIHYYKVYGMVDTDIQLITFNCELIREDLHIISSSRCLLLGNLALQLDQRELKCTSKMITNVSCFRKLKDVTTSCTNLFIIQKESALHQINQQLSKYFIQNQEPLWFKSTIFITAKGYPDSTCRSIVELLSKKIEKIYYLGDEDIYGVDILLSYAIGFNNFSTILHKIEWIELNSMIDKKSLDFQYQMISKEDIKKYLEIFNRNFIKDLEDFIPKNYNEEQFKQKAIILKRRLREMKERNKKMELQSFFKYLPDTWIEDIIKQK